MSLSIIHQPPPEQRNGGFVPSQPIKHACREASANSAYHSMIIEPASTPMMMNSTSEMASRMRGLLNEAKVRRSSVSPRHLSQRILTASTRATTQRMPEASKNRNAGLVTNLIAMSAAAHTARIGTMRIERNTTQQPAIFAPSVIAAVNRA